jgi:hypothetical protein
LKNQKRNPTDEKKKDAALELRSSDSSSTSKGEGKRGAKEPLYLLRYE